MGLVWSRERFTREIKSEKNRERERETERGRDGKCEIKRERAREKGRVTKSERNREISHFVEAMFT